jgi:peptide/nickel transport system permease protein
VSSSATLIQPGLPVVIFVITLAGWPYMARIIRGQVLSLREKEFVEASKSLGAGNMRIIFREILPNLVAPIIVYTTLFIPANILLEAALSFLGVGVQPPQSSWGKMLADATQIFNSAWWYMLAPGCALLLTVLAFNLVGDGMQDALNPKGGRNR